MMKRLLLSLTLLGSLVAYPLSVAAQEGNWVEVTRNSVGDRFLVNPTSIESRGGFVWYWEYRDFPQPNNAIVGLDVGQPVYGVMFYRSTDCDSGATRLRRMVIHDQNRQVLRRVVYNDNGPLTRPAQGSSAEAVVRYACTHRPNTETPTSGN
ncbi:MAG TPA: surface-adhesin E family protein [Crinalium sp.]|jgi:hypothetical protein